MTAVQPLRASEKRERRAIEYSGTMSKQRGKARESRQRSQEAAAAPQAGATVAASRLHRLADLSMQGLVDSSYSGLSRQARVREAKLARSKRVSEVASGIVLQELQ